jgi:hypothetical protein
VSAGVKALPFTKAIGTWKWSSWWLWLPVMLKNANSVVSDFLLTLKVPLICEVESSIVCKKLKMFTLSASTKAMYSSVAEAGVALLSLNRPSPRIVV